MKRSIQKYFNHQIVLICLLACSPKETNAPRPPVKPEIQQNSQAESPAQQNATHQSPPAPPLRAWNTEKASFAPSCHLVGNEKDFDHLSSQFEVSNAALAAQLITFDSRWNEIFIAAQLQSAGFEKPQFFTNQRKGIYAYLTSNLDVHLVHFRGTADALGAVTDAGFIAKQGNGKDLSGLITLSDGLGFSGLIHSGFFDGYLSVKSSLESALSSKSKKPIVFVGHSLGGALATLAAARSAINLQPVHGVYTFGAPRVGNNKFGSFLRSLLSERVYRVTRGMDVVPHLPPSAEAVQPFFASSPYFAKFQAAILVSFAVLDYRHSFVARHISESKQLEHVIHDAESDLQFWNQVVAKRATDAAYSATLNTSHPLVVAHSAQSYACDLVHILQGNN